MRRTSGTWKSWGRGAVAAALLALALSPAARAEGAKAAEAKVVSDGGKADADGLKGLSVFGATPAVFKATGPGKLKIGLRAKAGEKAAPKFTVQLDGKQVETGTLELGDAKKNGAPPEKNFTLDVPAGVHDVVVGAKGGEGLARTLAGDFSADLSIPELEEDLPLEELAAKPEPKKTDAATPEGTEKPAMADAAAPSEPAAKPGATPWAVRLQPFAAVGMVRETGFRSALLPTVGAASSQFQIGAFVVADHGPLSMRGELRDGFYHRAYATRNAGPDGHLAVLEQDEQNLALGYTVGWDVIHHIDEKLAKTLTVSPFAGPAARLLLSDALPQSIVGIQLGARVDWAASDALTLGASGGWLGNWSFIQQLKYQGVPLLLGAPRSATDVRVDAQLKLNGPAHLRVAWDTEVMVLQLAYRSYQALSVSFDYGF